MSFFIIFYDKYNFKCKVNYLNLFVGRLHAQIKAYTTIFPFAKVEQILPLLDQVILASLYTRCYQQCMAR